jgi:ABC-type multidrug transport system fused ATPase/permease subunit
VVSALVVLISVLFVSQILDPEQTLFQAIVFAVIFAAAKFGDATIEYFDAIRRAQMNRALQAYLMRLVNRKLLDLDPVEALQFTKGELKTLVSSDVEAVEDFVTAAVAQWLPAVLMLLVLGPALVWISGAHGVVALIAAIAVTPIAVLGARGMERFQLRAQKEQDDLTTAIGEWVRNIRLVRFLGWQSHFSGVFQSAMRRFTMQFAGRHLIACIIYGVTTSWWMVPIVSMLVYSELVDSPVTLAQLFSSVWILDHLMNYLQHVPYSLSMYGAAAASAERLRRLFGARSLTSQMTPSTGAIPGAPVAEIKFEGVQLAIEGKVLIDQLDLSLNLTERTAIVGEVGSGKTLLLELLLGERLPTAGTIWISFQDGTRRKLWEVGVYESFRKQVAYGPQQPFLSNSLVRHNIDLSTNGADEAINEAARRSQLTADLATFRQGLQEEVGETGINLSGGQKQRVSLARVFMSGRRILVLDDPLSAVDRSTERLLMDEILTMARGLVLVSHRLDELSRCNRVLVLAAGKIVEDGAPAPLTADTTSKFSQFLQAVSQTEGTAV